MEKATRFSRNYSDLCAETKGIRCTPGTSAASSSARPKILLRRRNNRSAGALHGGRDHSRAGPAGYQGRTPLLHDGGGRPVRGRGEVDPNCRHHLLRARRAEGNPGGEKRPNAQENRDRRAIADRKNGGNEGLYYTVRKSTA